MQYKGALAHKSMGAQLLSVFLVLLGMFLLLTLASAVLGLVFAQNGQGPELSSNRNVLLLVQAVSSVVVFGLTAWLSAWMLTRKPVANYMRFSKISLSWLAFGLGIYLLSMPLSGILAQLNESMHLPESMAAIEQAIRQMEDTAQAAADLLTSGSGWGLFVAELVVIALIPGLVEEMLFRGVIQNQLQRKGMNGHLAVWLSAALFSFIHFQFFGFLPRLFMGAILGYLFWYGRSIWVNIAAHCLNNTLALVGIWITNHCQSQWVAEAEEADCLSLGFVVTGIACMAVAVGLLRLMRYSSSTRLYFSSSLRS